MANRSSINISKRTGVNSNERISNRSNNATRSVSRVSKPLLQNASIKNTGNGRKSVRVTVNRNTRIKIKKS